MCAAESLGQLAPEQLASLERHMVDCADCRGAYADYSHIAGLEYSLREHDTTVNSAEANDYLNSTLLRSRFLARAEDEGIVFSEQVERPTAESRLLSFPMLRFHRSRTLVAVAAAVVLVASASLISYRLGGRGVATNAAAERTIQYPEATTATICQSKDQLLRDSLARQRSEEHTSELQSHLNLVCRLLLEKKKKKILIIVNFRLYN